MLSGIRTNPSSTKQGSANPVGACTKLLVLQETSKMQKIGIQLFSLCSQISSTITQGCDEKTSYKFDSWPLLEPFEFGKKNTLCQKAISYRNCSFLSSLILNDQHFLHICLVLLMSVDPKPWLEPSRNVVLMTNNKKALSGALSSADQGLQV